MIIINCTISHGSIHLRVIASIYDLVATSSSLLHTTEFSLHCSSTTISKYHIKHQTHDRSPVPTSTFIKKSLPVPTVFSDYSTLASSNTTSKLVTMPHATKIWLSESTEKVFQELLGHITGKPPDNEVLKSLLREGGWVPGEDPDANDDDDDDDIEYTGHWRCTRCNGIRTFEETKCPTSLCEGVNHNAILEYIFTERGLMSAKVRKRAGPCYLRGSAGHK